MSENVSCTKRLSRSRLPFAAGFAGLLIMFAAGASGAVSSGASASAACDGTPQAQDKEDTPQAIVKKMHESLKTEKYQDFYNDHCHKHIRDQLSAARFEAHVKSEQGAKMITLFKQVVEAIDNAAGEDTLIAKASDEPDQFEFILVKAREQGGAWHIELQKEDGRWKLMDFD